MDTDISGSVVGGNYSVDKKIQSGYFGTTWLARDLRTNGEVCLKTFFRENASQKKELGILKKLSAGNFRHDNLCAILDVCDDRAPICDWRGDLVGSVQYVVFEYCSGADLFNFLVTGPFERSKNVSRFSEPLARHYFMQALLAVMYLHERGVFHRDIKPENCVLDHNFNLKLTDFGTNKFLPASSDPGQLLRASTKKVGTDSYRAPEVDSGVEYDPSAADVWSLGVMLFFMVAIETMVDRARNLDSYLKPLLAPLGIFFPFPYECRLLDSYMRKDSDISSAKAQYNLTVSQLFPNQRFWEEWRVLKELFSPDLVDFFNCMFVLSPAHRVVLRDLAGHPWLVSSSGPHLTADNIVQQMNDRSPQNVVPNVHASPSIVAQKLTGGVDQAILRQVISSHGNLGTSSEYLSDSQVWVLTEELGRVENLQIDMAAAEDIQNFMLDISFVRGVLRSILENPESEKSRSVLYSDIQSGWVTQLLGVVGFLPHSRLLYLTRDRLDPTFTGQVLEVIGGMEFAVSQDIVKISNADLDEDMYEGMEEDIDNGSHKICAQTSLSLGMDGDGTMEDAASMNHSSCPPVVQRRRSMSEPTSPKNHTPLGSMDPQSSQDSCWTYGTSLSTQSSQEDLPEAMLDTVPSDTSHSHKILPLPTTVDRSKPFQFKSAGEFCKMSGLLCSYGYRQVVIGGQLALYCSGNTTCFSARVVFLPGSSGCIAISSWCFQGPEEWLSIMQRLQNDMQVNL